MNWSAFGLDDVVVIGGGGLAIWLVVTKLRQPVGSNGFLRWFGALMVAFFLVGKLVQGHAP